MRKSLITSIIALALATAASAALQVQVVTIKPHIEAAELLIEYQIVDDHDTPSTADDTVLRHGELVTMAYGPETSTGDVQAAAWQDSWVKGLTTPPEGWTPPAPEEP